MPKPANKTLDLFIIFLMLQWADALSTILGVHLGAHEGMLFPAFLMAGLGFIPGLFLTKLSAVGIALLALATHRTRALRLGCWWYAGVVVWNLALCAIATLAK